MSEHKQIADQRIRADQAMVLVIDYQEKLFAAMPEKAGKRHLGNMGALLRGMQTLGIPAIVTEQYPRGIGPTLSEVKDALAGDLAPVEKVEFSCCENDDALAAIRGVADKGRRSVIVSGMETHICVYQTVLDLLERGLNVHVVADTCLSRRRENWERGLALCERAGAVITSTETVLFQLLGKAGSPEFKTISKLIQ